jgi:hypothetical protein
MNTGASPKQDEEEEEDLGVLIYREVQLRKAEAAEMKTTVSPKESEKEEEDLGVLIYREVQLRKAEAAVQRKRKKVAKTRSRKKCCAGGCANRAVEGGVYKRQGAKSKKEMLC